MRKKDIFFCVILLVTVFFIRKIPVHRLFEQLGFGIYSKGLKVIFLSLFIIVLCFFVARWKNILIEGGFNKPDKKNFWLLIMPVIYPGILFFNDLQFGCFSHINTTLFSLLLIFGAAFMEEVLFRGVIQGYLISNWQSASPNTICIISAIFFSLIHLSNLQYADLPGVIQQVVYSFIIGLVFSALLFKTNSVWMLGILHGVLNLISYRCDDEIIVSSKVSAISYQYNFSDFGNLVGEILLFSPLFLIYWFLLKTIEPVSIKIPEKNV